MKKGDIVTINDSSWSKSVVNGTLVHELFDCDSEENKQYKIVETGCVFPAEDNQAYGCLSIPGSFNDTVIQTIDSGKVIFIEERFLELVSPTHKVLLELKVYEISDKLYKEVKRESQTQ